MMQQFGKAYAEDSAEESGGPPAARKAPAARRRVDRPEQRTSCAREEMLPQELALGETTET